MIALTHTFFDALTVSCHPHLPKVEDETVSPVEAAPGQLHLLGTNVAFPFDLVQPVHRPRALSLPEARLHTALLLEKQKTVILA